MTHFYRRALNMLRAWRNLRANFDPGTIGCVEELRLNRRDEIPAERVEVCREEGSCLVESSRTQLLPYRTAENLCVDLGFPQHLEGLVEGVLFKAREADTSSGGSSLHALDEVLPGPDPHKLPSGRLHVD
jgi:hypothetical protein